MPLTSFIVQIEYVQEQVREQEMFHRWVANYEHIMTFEEFKARLKPTKTTANKNKKEILDDVESIIGLYGGGGNIV